MKVVIIWIYSLLVVFAGCSKSGDSGSASAPEQAKVVSQTTTEEVSQAALKDPTTTTATTEVASEECSAKGAGWTWNSSGNACRQNIILVTSQQQCGVLGTRWTWDASKNTCVQAIQQACSGTPSDGTQQIWDAVKNQCIQYINTPDVDSTTSSLCESAHSTSWVWVSTSATSGSCVEIVVGTEDQCDSLSEEGYSWDTNTRTCGQPNLVANLKAQCLAAPGYYWNPANYGCQPASALSENDCDTNSDVSLHQGAPIELVWSYQLKMCLTRNREELTCRLATKELPGATWNYLTMSCQYCPAGQDLFGWNIDRTPICKAPPYVSVEIGNFHGCARLRQIGGYPNVQCWGDVSLWSKGPPGSYSDYQLYEPYEFPSDTGYARTMRTAKTLKSGTVTTGFGTTASTSSDWAGWMKPGSWSNVEAPDSIPFLLQQPGQSVTNTSPLVSLAVGTYASCAIVGNNLQCWGRSDFLGVTQSPTARWMPTVYDLTANLGRNPSNLVLKKVTVSKTDPAFPKYFDNGSTQSYSADEQNKEVFCLLADDYTTGKAVSAVYCWGNPQEKAGIFPSQPPTYASNTPVLVPQTTINGSAKSALYADIYVDQYQACVVTPNTQSVTCWGITAASTTATGTATNVTTTLANATSYSHSRFVDCYLQNGSPLCKGIYGYATGDFSGATAQQFSPPMWDPTPLIATNANLQTGTNTNLFIYDIPENPQTMTFISPLTWTQATTGTEMPVQYLLTKTQTAVGTSVPSAPAFSNLKQALSARSIQNPASPGTFSPPATDAAQSFSKLVTLRAGACGIDGNQNVWCWGYCNNAGKYAPNLNQLPGGPGAYCRFAYSSSTSSSTGPNAAVGIDGFTYNFQYGILYSGNSSAGRMTPTKVAWAGFIFGNSGSNGTDPASMTKPYRKVVGIPPSATGATSTDGTKLQATTPYLDHIIDLFAGPYTVCALRDVNSSPSDTTYPQEVFCWGLGGYGQLGDGTGNSSFQGTISTSSVSSITAVATSNDTNITTSTSGTTTTYTQTLTVTNTATLNPPVVTAIPGSYIGQPTFVLPKK